MVEKSRNKRIITIAGKPGSGKSTASHKIAEALGFEHFSSGDLFRAIGKERGVDVHDTNILAETEKDIDYLVDERLRVIGETQENVAIDSRMAWHWIPDSFKVYLDLDLTHAAERILSKLDPERIKHEHIPSDPVQYVKVLKSRLASESKRYEALYRVNPYDVANYDLVVDTFKNSPDEVAQRILSEYKRWLAS